MARPIKQTYKGLVPIGIKVNMQHQNKGVGVF